MKTIFGEFGKGLEKVYLNENSLDEKKMVFLVSGILEGISEK
jgi:hypothetical protein